MGVLLLTKASLTHFFIQGLVVQSWIRANPGLTFSPLILFVYFYTSINFKTLGKETSADTGKASEKIFPHL